MRYAGITINLVFKRSFSNCLPVSDLIYILELIDNIFYLEFVYLASFIY